MSRLAKVGSFMFNKQIENTSNESIELTGSTAFKLTAVVISTDLNEVFYLRVLMTKVQNYV